MRILPYAFGCFVLDHHPCFAPICDFDDFVAQLVNHVSPFFDFRFPSGIRIVQLIISDIADHVEAWP
jgi:hypothetical protein